MHEFEVLVVKPLSVLFPRLFVTRFGRHERQIARIAEQRVHLHVGAIHRRHRHGIDMARVIIGRPMRAHDQIGFELRHILERRLVRAELQIFHRRPAIEPRSPKIHVQRHKKSEHGIVICLYDGFAKALFKYF